MRVSYRLWLVVLLLSPAAMAGSSYVALPGGRFVSALAGDRGQAQALKIAPFAMRVAPVTIAEFEQFLARNPYWARDRIPQLLASADYLKDWASPLRAGTALPPSAPVTQVSWFAARAYCASEDAHLPSWTQWEYAAAADVRRADARDDDARNQLILSATLQNTGHAPGPVGQDPANVYGLHNLAGLVWEWVDDYGAMFPRPDARDPGQGNSLALCGGSALAFHDRGQYALMMRVAVLSTLKPDDSTANLGFRCVRAIGE